MMGQRASYRNAWVEIARSGVEDMERRKETVIVATTI
jgi:hypothetical protein